MTMQLKLDTNALVALFPEGSTARVELQSAVIAEFIKKHIKPTALGPDIHSMMSQAQSTILAMVQTAKKEVIASSLKEFGVSISSWGEVTISDPTKRTIKDAVMVAVREEINEAIGLVVATLQGVLEHNTKVAVNKLVDAEISAAVKEKVSRITKGMLG